MLYDFRWIQWNVDKVEKHGCTRQEAAEQVVNHPARGFLEVVYLIDPDGRIFVTHAMPLTSRRRRGGR